MPLALSLALTDAKKASEVNTSVNEAPLNNKANPVASGENINTGTPTPIRKALSNDRPTPANSLNRILVRLIGCEDISSINSYEL